MYTPLFFNYIMFRPLPQVLLLIFFQNIFQNSKLLIPAIYKRFCVEYNKNIRKEEIVFLQEEHQMTINGTKTGSALTIAIKGRLDTSTAPQLDTFISENIDGVTSITFDFTDLSYISSAGLRSLLSTHKKMIGKGEMTVTNVNDIVSEIFEITGFSDILNIV